MKNKTMATLSAFNLTCAADTKEKLGRGIEARRVRGVTRKEVVVVAIAVVFSVGNMAVVLSIFDCRGTSM